MPIRYDFSKMYWGEDRPDMKWPEDYKTYFGAFGLPHNTLTHVGHCTVESCKYGDKDCPILNGIVKPVFEFDDDWELRRIEKA